MCYSAECWALYDAYVREFGADIKIKEFWELYLDRDEKYRIRHKLSDGTKIPKGMDLNFLRPQSELERKIQDLIGEWNGRKLAESEAELAKQQARLAAAEAKLAVKETKTALNEQRIAGNKIKLVVPARCFHSPDWIRWSGYMRVIFKGDLDDDAQFEGYFDKFRSRSEEPLNKNTYQFSRRIYRAA